jgi:hypothetical protein
MSADIGLGAAALGGCIVGFGEPGAADNYGGSVFRDLATGASLTGRYIDPKTRQYVYDQYGRALGQSTVPQLVQLALTTKLGSSTVSTLGQRFGELDVIDESFDGRARAFVDQALADLVSKNLVEVLSVDIDRVAVSGERIHVRWKDLTTDLEHTTKTS